jgi:hypothetical protein
MKIPVKTVSDDVIFLRDPEKSVPVMNILKFEWNRITREDLEYHLHPEGEIGASGVTGCNWKYATDAAGITTIIVEGIKAEKGGLWTGTWRHEKIQSTLKEYFNRMKDKYPDLVYIEELYIPIDVLDEKEDIYHNGKKVGTTHYKVRIVSPIDIAFLSKEGYVMKPLKFKNKTFTVPMLAPGARCLQIFDIKSAGNYAYYKMHKFGLNPTYIGQFHCYMRMAELNQIICLDSHKAKARMFTLTCNWDHAEWQKVLDMVKRKLYLAWIMKYNEKQFITEDKIRYKIKKSDFNCLMYGIKDCIEWYSCPQSYCHEEKMPSSEPKLILDKLCWPAQKMVIAMAMKKFKVGSVWKYGRAIVTIQSINKETVKGINKSKKQYHLSIYDAYQKLKPT